jgi:single-stranded DNA-specific DHH superfamily exonuclease
VNKTTIKVFGIVACHVVKHYNTYEIVFAPEETFNSIYKGSVQEVHAWLDLWYGAEEWVAE